MHWQDTHPEEAQLALSLQRMWPHREHESGILRQLMCVFGVHLWLQPDYTAFARRNSVRFLRRVLVGGDQRTNLSVIAAR